MLCESKEVVVPRPLDPLDARPGIAGLAEAASAGTDIAMRNTEMTEKTRALQPDHTLALKGTFQDGPECE